jgi:hypothetical protein
LPGKTDRITDHRPAIYLVKDFGNAGFHAGTLAGGKNHRGKPLPIHEGVPS